MKGYFIEKNSRTDIYNVRGEVYSLFGMIPVGIRTIGIIYFDEYADRWQFKQNWRIANLSENSIKLIYDKIQELKKTKKD